MTGLGQVMKEAGYRTYFAGKWDVGMATKDHTPLGRGYDKSLSYFHHLNDYWNEKCYDTAASTGLTSCRVQGGGEERPTDLWLGPGDGTEGPARGLNNSVPECTVRMGGGLASSGGASYVGDDTALDY